MLVKSVIIFLIFTRISDITAQRCPSGKILNIKDIDDKWICSASSSFQGMGCQNLFDQDYFTYWHPLGRGAGARVSLQLSEEITLRGIKVYQHEWLSGHATEITVHFGEATLKLKADRKTNFIWNGIEENRELTGSMLTLEVTEVKGGLMGSLREIQFIGCHIKKEENPTYIGPTNGPYRNGDGSGNVVSGVLYTLLALVCAGLVGLLVFVMIKTRKKYAAMHIVQTAPPSEVVASIPGSVSNLSRATRSQLGSRVSLASRASRGSRVSLAASHVSRASRQSRRSRRSRTLSRCSGRKSLTTQALVHADGGSTVLNV